MESVLPLFTGEGIQDTIENLNKLVIKLLDHGFDTATDVVRAIVGIGMAGIREKLTGVPHDKLIPRVSDSWAFFFGSVLPYLQGVFEPMNAQHLMLSSKWDPTVLHQGEAAQQANVHSSAVRDFVLEMYRKEVLLPLLERIERTFLPPLSLSLTTLP